MQKLPYLFNLKSNRQQLVHLPFLQEMIPWKHLAHPISFIDFFVNILDLHQRACNKTKDTRLSQCVFLVKFQGLTKKEVHAEKHTHEGDWQQWMMMMLYEFRMLYSPREEPQPTTQGETMADCCQQHSHHCQQGMIMLITMCGK